ncbi:unnamed protein product [Oncorhynchus mykiss]|uniref:Uncharacterized protein n=1 Tax=Oncorhynchus mykiss TaxID=8022 RepID=A0A060YF51_ONCMY|nr:unnamed protein product [Oncorhynchus mykiss]
MYKQSENRFFKCGEKTSPISVILVTSGSRGNKLLFRYPFQQVSDCTSSLTTKQRSPYALNTTGDVLEDPDGDSRYWSSYYVTYIMFPCLGLYHDVEINNIPLNGDC